MIHNLESIIITSADTHARTSYSKFTQPVNFCQYHRSLISQLKDKFQFSKALKIFNSAEFYCCLSGIQGSFEKYIFVHDTIGRRQKRRRKNFSNYKIEIVGELRSIHINFNDLRLKNIFYKSKEHLENLISLHA